MRNYEFQREGNLVEKYNLIFDKQCGFCFGYWHYIFRIQIKYWNWNHQKCEKKVGFTSRQTSVLFSQFVAFLLLSNVTSQTQSLISNPHQLFFVLASLADIIRQSIHRSTWWELNTVVADHISSFHFSLSFMFLIQNKNIFQTSKSCARDVCSLWPLVPFTR